MSKSTKEKRIILRHEDFVIETVSAWSTQGIKFNKGNINILKYAFMSQVAWALYRKQSLPESIKNQYLSYLQTSLWPMPLRIDPTQLYFKY